jgi:hypothetical protein
MSGCNSPANAAAVLINNETMSVVMFFMGAFESVHPAGASEKRLPLLRSTLTVHAPYESPLLPAKHTKQVKEAFRVFSGQPLSQAQNGGRCGISV